MAANFRTSSHCKQLLDPDEVNVAHPIDKDNGLTPEELKLIKIHMTNYVSRLAQFVKVRQRVVATAVTYFRRVYVRKSMTECDPRLVAPTCLYLAAKAEESTVQIQMKDNVYHSYCALTQLLPDAGLTDLTSACWGIINDTYRMDLIRVHPPYMIALACIYIASALKDRETTAWFEELRVDMNGVKNISIEILDFYDSYKPTPEERINGALNKLLSKA